MRARRRGRELLIVDLSQELENIQQVSRVKSIMFQLRRKMIYRDCGHIKFTAWEGRSLQSTPVT
jgi:hypothetical protein